MTAFKIFLAMFLRLQTMPLLLNPQSTRELEQESIRIDDMFSAKQGPNVQKGPCPRAQVGADCHKDLPRPRDGPAEDKSDRIRGSSRLAVNPPGTH